MLAAILENGGHLQKYGIHIFDCHKKVVEVPHLKFVLNIIVSEMPMVAQLSYSPCICLWCKP